MPRFKIFTLASGVNLTPADTWQQAADTAAQWLTANTHPDEAVIVEDTQAGNPWPFTTYKRSDSLPGVVGTPHKPGGTPITYPGPMRTAPR